jgi:hypothetical protein
MKRMKRLMSAVAAFCFLAVTATGVKAQTDTRTHSEQTTKESGPDGKTKIQTETVVGMVKDYEAGKKIKIAGPDNKTYSFDLDENARVEGSISVGQMAKVEFTKSNKGRKSVRVLSQASREDVETKK